MGIEHERGNSDLGRRSIDREKANARIIQFEKNLTPISLEGKIDPLCVSITEILPNYPDKKIINQPFSEGFIINTGTHREEGTPLQVGLELEEIIKADNIKRPVVIIRGLYEAVEVLSSYMLNQNPSEKGAIDETDINRCFTEDPQTLFEELAQNYLKFVTGRYSPNMNFIDIHSDPKEHAMYSHIILDRTLPPVMNKAKYYKWAVKTFRIPVMWDISEAEGYSQERLDKSLSGALLKHGYKTVTYETSAGKAVDDLKSTAVLFNLLEILKKEKTLFINKRRLKYLHQKLLTILNKKMETNYKQIPQEPEFNKLIGKNKQLKRQILTVNIDSKKGGGHFIRAPGIMSRNGRHLLSKGTVIGDIVYYKDKSREHVTMKEKGFLLGIPEEGNLFPSKSGELLFSVVVRED